MVISFDLHKARKAVRKAKQALKAAEERFDTACAPDNTLSLISQIKAAERRVAEARADLRKLDPNSTE
jgi:multidrug resistance efflux pump